MEPPTFHLSVDPRRARPEPKKLRTADHAELGLGGCHDHGK
jgi:hypothetical protein